LGSWDAALYTRFGAGCRQTGGVGVCRLLIQKIVVVIRDVGVASSDVSSRSRGPSGAGAGQTRGSAMALAAWWGCELRY